MNEVNMETMRELARKRIEEAKALPLKRDFLDDGYWQELAKDWKVRLPTWTLPPEPRTMRRWLRRLRVREREYLDACGFDKLDEFIEKNPEWPLRAWVGVLLEYVQDRELARETLRKQPE